MTRKLMVVLLILSVSACEYPRDSEGTYEEIRQGILKIGFVKNPPWVTDRAQGKEAELIQDFAAEKNLRIQWTEGSEQTLVEDLEMGKIHLLMAGLEPGNPWEKKMGVTREITWEDGKKTVFGIRKGENGFLARIEKFLLEKREKK